MLQKSGFVVFRKNYNDLETNSFIVLYKNSIDNPHPLTVCGTRQ